MQNIDAIKAGRFVGILILLFSVFVFGTIAGYNPIIGIVVVAPIVYTVLYFMYPFLFLRAFLVTLGFAAFLNLPVTDGGFPVSTGIMMSGFIFWSLTALLKKDPEFVLVYFRRTEHLLVSGFLIVMLVSVMKSKMIGTSAVQIQLFIYCWLVFMYLQMMVRKREHFEAAVFWIIFAGVIVGLMGLLELVIHATPYSLLSNKSLFMADVNDVVLNAHEGRINGLIGDAPFHGIYMVIILCLALYKFLTTPSRWAKAGLGFVMALAAVNILLSASRGAVISMGLALMVFWMFLEIRGKWFIFGVIGTACISLVAIVILTMPSMELERLYSSEGQADETAKMRVGHIPVALNMFLDNPIIGTGPDGFVINYAKYAADTTSNAYKKVTMKTHNTPLQVLAEYGLVGFAVLSLLYVLTLKRLFTIIRNSGDKSMRYLALALMSTLAGYLFFLATSNTLLDKNIWMVIGLSQCLFTVYGSAEEPSEAKAG